ncbi:hypothetical protein DFH08DRAFT_391585 [Mycena albidolilacea]|uniref:Jacalin-type lectin domain-containing protein n=1 Tax=Mycena albidolilacea TaxID=1033008 RepID=A0AAD6ZFP2_9AGAR|nr:hypothetical protein DFH08DRAFT_391585 [Mycena albidolilacea]
MTSIQNTAIMKSPLIEVDNGNLFDDINSVVGPNNASINTADSIKSIRVIYAEVVNGLTIEYRETKGSTIVQAHDTTADLSGKLDTGLKQEVITLKDTQVIIAVTGMHGATTHSGSLGGRRVAQIIFVLFDKADRRVETKGPFGSLIATPFSVTADGNFVAFGGYAFNQTQSVAHKPTGGLFGLTLHDVAYRRVD